MKCLCCRAVLIICAFLAIDCASANAKAAAIVTIVNLNNGHREVVHLRQNATLSEARSILNISSSYIFYRHSVETVSGVDQQFNAAISMALEPSLTIDDIIYGDGNVYYGSWQRDLDVIHIHDERRTRRLKIEPAWLEETLAKFRTKLGSLRFGLDDAFYVKVDTTYSAIFNESEHTLNEIIRDGRVYIGTARGNISKFLTGVKVDSNGNLVACNFKVADLKKIVIPNDVNYAGFDSKFTSNFQQLKTMQSGITDVSFSVGGGAFGVLNFFSASEQMTSSHMVSRSSERYTSYNFAAYIIEKQEIEITRHDLQISNNFYTELLQAMEQGQQKIEKAMNIVRVLQKFGWYVPLHFKTGGAFREYKSSEVSSEQEAKEESNKFGAEFKAGFAIDVFDISGSTKIGSESQSQRHSQRKKENTVNVRTSVGGDGTAFNMEAFGASLQDPEKWKIIEHKRLFPTLMLLHDYNNWALSQSMRLLSDYRRQLQVIEAGINIEKYVQNIEQMQL